MEDNIIFLKLEDKGNFNYFENGRHQFFKIGRQPQLFENGRRAQLFENGRKAKKN
jgi:hypothetical protein